MKYTVFYSTGQYFEIQGQWIGVEKLANKLIAPTIKGKDGSMNLLDPRALVIGEDSTVVYNGREWSHQMSKDLRKAMPSDWPHKLIKFLKL